jgi:hemerythrin-like domain-containing protein
MTSHHKECDTQFALAEKSIADSDWKQGHQQWSKFSTELTHHFSQEEIILFPKFEQVTGMTGGPTQMMRLEHKQMRELLTEIDKALLSQDQEQCLALTETLMITMQQHNMKEEQILYPMIDQSLSDAIDTIEQMKIHR